MRFIYKYGACLQALSKLCNYKSLIYAPHNSTDMQNGITRSIYNKTEWNEIIMFGDPWFSRTVVNTKENLFSSPIADRRTKYQILLGKRLLQRVTVKPGLQSANNTDVDEDENCVLWKGNKRKHKEIRENVCCWSIGQTENENRVDEGGRWEYEDNNTEWNVIHSLICYESIPVIKSIVQVQPSGK